MSNDFSNIPGSQRVLAALDALETGGVTASSSAPAAEAVPDQQTLFELASVRDENRRLKDEQKNVAKRLSKLIKTVESWPEQV